MNRTTTDIAISRALCAILTVCFMLCAPQVFAQDAPVVDVSDNVSDEDKALVSGDGDDDVDNDDDLDASANAVSGTDAGTFTEVHSESTSVDASSNASAEATGIEAGPGADDVTNSGAVGSDAVSISTSIAGSVTALDPGDPFATVQSDLNADATSRAAASGIVTSDGRTVAGSRIATQVGLDGLQISTTRSVTTQIADDAVDNSGAIVSSSAATSIGNAMSGSLAASGSANVSSVSSATAASTGIATGGGSDTIINTAAIGSDSAANASSVSINLSAGQGLTATPGESPSANGDASATARASALGIDTEGTAHSLDTNFTTTTTAAGITTSYTATTTADAGDDAVDSLGNISATSTATTGATGGGASLSSDGPSSLDANARAISNSGAISTGGGNDRIDSLGALSSSSESGATGLAMNFDRGGSGTSASANANVYSESAAFGVSADGNGHDTINNTTFSLGTDGVSLSRSEQELAHVGNDTISSGGAVSAIAMSISAGGALPAAIDGSSSSSVNSNAHAQAAALDAGGGDDSVSSAGALNASAEATSAAISLAFGQSPTSNADAKATAEASSTADATATGIAGDSNADRIETETLAINSDGLSFIDDKQVLSTSGSDVIDALGAITATASATSGAAAVPLSIDSVASASVDSDANSRANSILGGGGDDTITSAGALMTSATANAVGVSAGIAQRGTSSNGTTNVEASIDAEAEATGIAGDGGAGDKAKTFEVNIDASGFSASDTSATFAATGNDVVVNGGLVTSNAVANTVGAAAVLLKSPASAKLDSTAAATARGLDAGGGSDSIVNSGGLTATATTLAGTVNIASSSGAGATANSGFLGAGTEAQSDAVGLSSAGRNHENSTTLSGDIRLDTISVTGSWVKVDDDVTGDGADTISNGGAVTSRATATTVQGAAGISGQGLALAVGRAEADAHAGGIESGNGDDDIQNTGELTSDASATAVAVNASIAPSSGQAIAGNAAWDGGTVASASAMGIDADSGLNTTTRIDFEASSERAQIVYDETAVSASGNDTVANTGDITSNATSVSPSVTVAFTASGVSAAVSTSNADAVSNGIRGGQGDDAIANDGTINTQADSVAATLNVSIATSGAAVAADAVWDGGTTADSTAIGIAGDGGDLSTTTRLAVGTDEVSYGETSEIATGADTIFNTGDVTATANATSAAAAAGGTATGVGIATATSTASAYAAAIDAGAGEEVDDVYNRGTLTSDSQAVAASASIGVATTGVALAANSVWDGGTTADARSRGIDVGAGGETLLNDGAISTSATAGAGAASASVAVTGFAGAAATATADANAVAIDASAGEDDDSITNNGELAADADAVSAALSVAFTAAGVSGSTGTVWDGGTTADAFGRGIDTGAGADTIDNNAKITAEATSTSVEASIAVAIKGISAALATSTAESDASAVDAGEGNDMIENDGDIDVDSSASAVAVDVAFTGLGIAGAADAVWDGGTTSHAVASGIDGGDGDDVISSGDGFSNDTTAKANTNTVAVSVSGAGFTAALTSSNATAEASGISAGAGNDTVVNDSDITSIAEADAAEVAVTATGIGGGASGSPDWDGGVNAQSDAKGIDLGEGDDVAGNSGVVNANADSDFDSNNVSLTLIGVAAGIANSVVESSATGFDGAAGVDAMVNSGEIHANAKSSATARTIDAAVGGYTVNEANTDATAIATAMGGGDGNDTIVNEEGATVTANSDANAKAIAVTVSLVGAANASAGPRATTIATGMDGGAGADTIVNEGTVRVGPAEDATGDALWMSRIETTSFSLGLAGASGSESESTSRSTATGMAGGDDDDVVSNRADVKVRASARNRSTDSTLELFGSASALSESGAVTRATGLDGGAGNDVIESLQGLDVSAESLLIRTRGDTEFTLAGTNSSDSGLVAATTATGVAGQSGDDSILTAGMLTVNAVSRLDGNGGSTTIFGTSSASGTSSARTTATGVDGGAGVDQMINDAIIDVDASARLDAKQNASTIFGGSSTSSDTGARSFATGMSGGDDADVLRNNEGASIDVSSSANVTTNSVSYTFVGAPTSTVGATSETATTGMSGGAGDDTIINHSDLTVASDASIKAVGKSTSTIVVPGTNTRAGGTTVGSANATGLSGGDGNDLLASTSLLNVRAKSLAETQISARDNASLSSNAVAEGTARASVTAVGLAGGAGANEILTGGTVNVLAESNGFTLAYANGAQLSLNGAATTRSESGSSAVATGIEAADGANAVVNEAFLNVEAKADNAKTFTLTSTILSFQTPDEFDDPRDAVRIDSDIEEVDSDMLPELMDDGAYADGEFVFWTQSDMEDPNIGPEGAYYRAERTVTTDDDGNDEVTWAWVRVPVNVYVITDDIDDPTPSSATSIGQGLGGNGRATATGSSSAVAYGMHLGNGDNIVENRDRMRVMADADSWLRTTAAGGSTGNAYATTNQHWL